MKIEKPGVVREFDDIKVDGQHVLIPWKTPAGDEGMCTSEGLESINLLSEQIRCS